MSLVDSILLIDDDVLSNLIHEKLILKLNIVREVFVKPDGMEAINFIEQRYRSARSLPSLILLDINMPETDGFKFVSELRNSELLAVKNIPVAFLTTSGEYEDTKRIKDMGYYYIQKPLTESKFISALKKTISAIV